MDLNWNRRTVSSLGGKTELLADEPLDHCLTCETIISKFQWATNNGVCDECPKLTAIAPQFWKVILNLANAGYFEAVKTVELYG